MTAIIGKSTPYQLDENLDKLVSYLVENSNLKIMNSFSSGNTFGAINNLDNVKNLRDFTKNVSSENTDLLFVVGSDPIGRSVFSNEIHRIIEDIDNVVCLDLFLHETSELGNYIIPTSSTLGEKEGTFTNIEFRTSRIDKLVPSPGQSLSDWEFISGLSNFCNFNNNIDSLDGLNELAYQDFDNQDSPSFKNLDKPSNFDGIINDYQPNISTELNENLTSKYFVGKKLYGDNITIRYSDSISILGAKQFIEASESTIEKLNLSSGECTLKQNGHNVSANYVVNNKLADGVIFIPQNRRNFNRFDFSETIEISPNQSKEALNVN